MFQQDQIKLANYHLSYYILWASNQYLFHKSSIKCPNLKKHISNLIIIFGLSELNKDCGQLYDCGYFNNVYGKDQLMTLLKSKIADIRPQAINLIEAIDVPDSTLNSSIGNQFGDIYETYFNNARRSKLNLSTKDRTKTLLSTFGDVIL